MQLPPPVEVMRTALAVTEPLVAAGPNADTQSPTARAPEVTACEVLTGVELEVVTLSVSVLGFAGRFVWLLDLPRAAKLPGEIEIPEIVSVDPLTPVTFPDAMSKLASCLRKLFPAAPPAGKFREPLPGNFCGPPPEPPRDWKPPAGGPPDPVPTRKLRVPGVAPQAPLLFGMVRVMLRAAMVVFDLLDADPVAVTQSPTATALTASVTLLENVVVDVQLTVV